MMQAVEKTWRMLSHEHESEIRFFYCESGGLTRLKSSLGAMLDRARDRLGPEPVFDNDAIERQLQKNRTFSRAWHALRAVGQSHEFALRAWVAPETFLSKRQSNQIAALGRLGPAMLFTTRLERWMNSKEMSGDAAGALERLHRTAKASDLGLASVMTEVRHEADALVKAAAAAYAAASGGKR